MPFNEGGDFIVNDFGFFERHKMFLYYYKTPASKFTNWRFGGMAYTKVTSKVTKSGCAHRECVSFA
jgi:hypothetical protein